MPVRLSNPRNPRALELTVAERLRHYRKVRGLTLKQLAATVGTTPQTAQRLENAKMTISVDWIARLCLALGVAPWQLFDHPGASAPEAAAMKAEMELAALKALLQRLCTSVGYHMPSAMEGGNDVDS